MIIKPYGFALWENMKVVLDQKFKATGHSNAYFPLFIPKSYLGQEANHIAGFAKECAVVTHYRLKHTPEEGLCVDPEARLSEELVVRPTSETIIWRTYKNWIQSYRDLPLLLNQWSNMVRWEMRPRLFLRTAEVLWQEGHTAHATREEAKEETVQMLDIYHAFARDYMALPVMRGLKAAHEKFAGAEATYTIEALMQDGKALQAGTSHFLGQTFSRAFDVKFANAQGQLDYVWGTSWGITTRLIGALIMTHADDEGLILPPKLAPIQVVIIPIYSNEEERIQIVARAKALQAQLHRQAVSVQLDDRNTYKPGWKFATYALKGVPIRAVIGPKDYAHDTIELVRRDTREGITVNTDNAVAIIEKLLEAIQNQMYQRAQNFKNEHTHSIDTYTDFKAAIAQQKGLILAHWDGTTATAHKIQRETQAIIRCIPLDISPKPGRCIYTGKPSVQRVAFAQAY